MNNVTNFLLLTVAIFLAITALLALLSQLELDLAEDVEAGPPT